jgi:hypothetical protein
MSSYGMVLTRATRRNIPEDTNLFTAEEFSILDHPCCIVDTHSIVSMTQKVGPVIRMNLTLPGIGSNRCSNSGRIVQRVPTIWALPRPRPSRTHPCVLQELTGS